MKDIKKVILLVSSDYHLEVQLYSQHLLVSSSL